MAVLSSQDTCLRFLLMLVVIGGGAVATAQHAAAPVAPAAYDPRITFGPLSLPDPVNAYRSSNGAPGPSYWQNEASYELHADLDTAAKQLSATETITYTNNSPDTLPSLWLQLDQNIYRKDARGQILFGGMFRHRRKPNVPAPAAEEVTSTEGFVFDSVEIEAGKQTTKASYIINDTRMQIRLAEPLKPHGGATEDPHQVPLSDPGRVGRAHFVGRVKAGRDL